MKQKQLHKPYRLVTMLLLVMAILMPYGGAWAQTQPSEGDGSSEHPFLINTAEELKWYASYVNGESGDNVVHSTACAQLMNDIDLSSVCGEGKGNWTPIAKYGIYQYNGKYRFDGVFDGNGHTISNLYINDQEGSYLGLFGYVTPTTNKTSVKNLKMTSVQIVGKTDIAAVCASGYYATFENIEVISGSIAGFSDIYGISGCRGSAKNCINRADVTASRYNVAGVISTIQDEASNCSNYGKITTGTGWAGGIAGGSDGMTILKNCANYGEIHVTGTVNSTDYAVGGLLGYPWNIEISNCANFGNIYLTEQSEFVGVIVGTVQLFKTSGILANTGKIYVDGVAQIDVSVLQSGIKWCEDDADNTATCIIPMAEQLASGWLAWQLQQNCSTQTWGQDLEQENTYPVLNGKAVYFSGSILCNGHLLSEAYTNDKTKEATTPAHSQEYDAGGFCTVCHESRKLHGTGIAEDPYLISSVEQLEYLRDQSNMGSRKITAHAKLVNDIDLSYASASSWIPVSKSYSNGFAGTFDGNGHCIKNLYSSFNQDSYVGLFGCVYGGTIKNLTVEGVIESSCSNQGMIAGYSVDANYYNCVVKGRITTNGSSYFVGGIAGNISNFGSSNPVVQGCASYVDIVSTGTYTAGLVGMASNGINMEACANYGNVTGTANVGALMGYYNPNSESHITNCYVGSCEVRGEGANVFLTCFEDESSSSCLSNYEKVFYSKDAKVFASADATEPEVLASRIAPGESNTSSAFVGLSAEQIAGGEATYRLNNETTVSPVWTQDLSQTNSQPELNGNAALYTVYSMGYLHGSTVLSFSNNQDDENTLHLEADNNGSHDKAFSYVSDGYGTCTHSATCRECGIMVESEACSRVNDICTKCNYGDLFELADGVAYTLAKGAEVGELNYARNFGGTNWTTWYVPFELTLTPELCQKYAFSRINNVHQYDDDNDGVADRTIVESFNQAEGVTLKANYPYLVRALTDADKKMTINLTEVALAKAESKHIDCMSVDNTYTFTGIYNGMGDGGNTPNSPLSLFDNSVGNKWLNFHSLPAQRHHLVITPRDGSAQTVAPARIMLQVIGDETATGIVNIYSYDKRSSETYDLSGRRVSSNQRGLLIKNGKKVFVK